MATILDEAFALLCWKTTGRAGQLRMWRSTRQKFHTMKAQIKERKGKQPGVNSLLVTGVQNSLKDGQRRACYNTMNFIQKYKRIGKNFMWKKGIGCVVNNTTRKRKRIIHDNDFTLKVNNLHAFCTGKLLMLAPDILKFLFFTN